MGGYFDRGAHAGGQDQDGYFDRSDVTGPEGVGSAMAGPGGASHVDTEADARHSQKTVTAAPLPDFDGDGEHVTLDETAGSTQPRNLVGKPDVDLLGIED